MNEAYQNLLNRRSVRSYKNEQIKKEELDMILEAGTGTYRDGKAVTDHGCLQDADKISDLSMLNARVMGVDSDPFAGHLL